MVTHIHPKIMNGVNMIFSNKVKILPGKWFRKKDM